ncbi:TniQ family protein [Paraburkholderia strydomiana]|uniref:TniQ family protein n=1 Tax=Paraburkholderia strydomiana TaxID=1245417 RepID=UPI0038BB0373
MFRISPVGMGSGRVEQLSSFAMRLAEAMAVSFADFFRELVAPQLYKKKRRPQRVSVVSKGVIDGMTRTAAEWVAALEDVASVGDLTTCTLLPYAGAIGPRRLVTTNRRWCPICLQEMANNGITPVYEPLVWRIEEVTICPFHNVRLVSECPKCKCGGQVPLVFNARVGCCRHCGAWMGQSTLSHDEQPIGEFEVHCALACDELLAIPGTLPEGRQVLPSKVAVESLRDVFFEGNGAAMARATGGLASQVNGYATGQFPAPLHFFLRAGYITGATMQDILVTNSFDVAASRRHDEQFDVRRAVPKRFSEQLAVDMGLQAALDGDGSTSVRAIAINLNLAPASVWRRNPTLASAVSRRHAAFVAAVAAKRRSEFEAAVHAAVAGCVHRGEQPTPERMKQALGDPACFLNDWKRATIRNAMATVGL